jgi:hypothetical protein
MRRKRKREREEERRDEISFIHNKKQRKLVFFFDLRVT